MLTDAQILDALGNVSSADPVTWILASSGDDFSRLAVSIKTMRRLGGGDPLEAHRRGADPIRVLALFDDMTRSEKWDR